VEVNDQLHAPGALRPEKSTLYAVDRRLGGPQIRSGRGGEEKEPLPLPLPGMEAPSSSPQPVTLLTELQLLKKMPFRYKYYSAFHLLVIECRGNRVSMAFFGTM